MRIRSSAAWIALAILTFGSSAASAAAVTYDFTGHVTQTSGSFAGLNGAPVSGSFTIDPDAFIALQSSGTPSSSDTWLLASYGGTYPHAPVPSALVFSESVTLNGIDHSTAPSSPYYTYSKVTGNRTVGELSTGFLLLDSGGFYQWWDLTFRPDSSAFASYLSTGLLDPDALDFTTSRGYYRSILNAASSQFDFTVTSVVARSAVAGAPVPMPTPLPAAAWLLASGLGLLSARMPLIRLRRAALRCS